MGLDVYLYRYEDHDATTALERDADAFSETTWAEISGNATYEQMSEAQREQARATVAEYNAAHGLGEYGADEARKAKIELPSAKYPDHYFKIGYFRSSYNEGGIDGVAGNAIRMGLRDIFGVTDEYEHRPDWLMAREVAVEFHRKLAAAPTLRIATIDAVSMFAGPSTVDQPAALSIVQRERERNAARPADDEWSSYSNRDGHFFLNTLAIVAAIPGVRFGTPCVHLVYDDPKGFAWYVQAAEIVIETIDYVLAQPDREKYWLHWSG